MAMSGAWFARIPIEPVVVRVETISTSSSNTLPSGVRTSTGKLLRAIAVLVLGGLPLLAGDSVPLAAFGGSPLGLLARPAGRVGHLVDRALQQERPLRDLVVLAVDDLLERAHRVLDRHVLALGP